MTAVEETVKNFFTAYPTQEYGKGDIIIFAYKDIPPVHYLVNGRVAQYDLSDDARKNTLTVYKPGTFFPMSGALAGIPNNHFFEALTAVTVHVVPAADAAAFVRQHPEVAYDLLTRLYKGMYGLLSRMSLLMDGTAEKRLLLELQIAADRFGERTADGDVHIAMTEAQLASQSGLARETISRQLKKLSESGAITRHRGGITIKQM
ncbi:MAG TPA: Crp/Fnr family transcriptional regulator [Candidatus Saccharimonadales bacterium]